MAGSKARLVISVSSTQTASTVTVSSKGAYKGLQTNDVALNLTGLPVFGTVSESAFWAAVLPYVQANV